MSKQRAPVRRRTGASPGRAAPARTAKPPASTAPGLQSQAGFTPQRKLKLGAANDGYEREADQIADRVMSDQPAPTISHLPASGLPASAQRAEAEKVEGGTEDEKKKENEGQETAQGRFEEKKKPEAEAKPEEDVGKAEEAEKEKESEEEKEEKDIVQKKSGEEELQDQSQEEEELQSQRREEEEEETAQAKPRNQRSADTRPGRSEAERAIGSPGDGKRIPGDVRRRIEDSTGADLSDVRVHDGPAAERATQALDARAFAHGRDIWLGPGESARDTRLMAHEAAHVVQQTGRNQAVSKGLVPSPAMAAGLVQREGEETSSTKFTFDDGGVVDLTKGAEKMTLPELSLPSVANKDTATAPYVAKPPGSRRSDQRDIWMKNISIDSSKVDSILTDDKGVGGEGEAKRFFLKIKNQKSFVIGTREEIISQSRIPNWTDEGKNEYFEVDHIKEAQLDGPHGMENFQLLDPETNKAAGDAIRQEIKKRIEYTRDATLKKVPAVDESAADPAAALRGKSADSIRSSFKKIEFRNRAADALRVNGGRNHLWKKGDIESARHIEKLDVLNDREINRYKLLGSPTQVKIYLGRGASRPRTIPWTEDGPASGGVKPNWGGKGFDLVGVDHSGGIPTQLQANIYKRNKLVQGSTIVVPLLKLGGQQYTFQMPTDFKASLAGKLSAKTMSPLEIEDSFLGEDSLVTRATLRPSPKIFKRDVAVDISIDGDQVIASKTFNGGEFDLPGPVKITESALTLTAGVGRSGASFSVGGDLKLEVERVGKGELHGDGSTTNGFSVSGSFDFDPALFKGANARITVGYASDKLSGSGTIKIDDGQIKGIKSASLEVTIEDDVWTADGTVEPKVPGVSEGSLSMTFDPNGGFEITGRLTLGKDIPRLKSGHLEATLKKEGGEDYILSGKGSAELDIPGVTAGLTAEYRDGLFKAEVRAGYERGLAKGSITVGATNMPVDENDAPAGDPGETLSIYGSGTVTVRFTPWLEGTAGIIVKPDGQIEVKGEVRLPKSVELFPEKKIEKELLSIGVDIPIVGIAVAGQRVGIFLNIGGNLSARASIGPGTLEDVAVEVIYNPEDEASARVTGAARFVVPAEAGLRLAIRGSIGAGIPIVSAQAGLELGGELGIEAEASAGATVEWTPATGISMEANVSVIGQPKFTFDVTGFVEVTADLFLTEVDLYSKRWQLAAVEYGSNLQVGARLKVQVENNEFKPISLDDIEFITPEINPLDTVKGLLKSL